MPNFDSFERFLKEALSQESDDVTQFAVDIARLPESEKVSLVKNRTPLEIETFLTRGRFALRSFFPHTSSFESSHSNMDGKDLREINSDTEIELKSGDEKTDANIGLGLVSWSVLDDDAAELKKIMSSSMKIRRDLYLRNAHREIEESKKQTMDQLHSYFTSRLKVGYHAPDRLQHLFKSISVGLTKSSEIISSFQGTTKKPPLMLQADWAVGLREYRNAFSSSEAILVEAISRNLERMQVICRGQDSRAEGKLYPNYKNSLSYQGVRIPSENWVNTACFHVWID